MVAVGEGELERAVLPGARPDEPVLEALDQAARSELYELIAPLAALERLALAGVPDELAGVVDHHEVTALRGTLRGLQAREALAQLLDLALHELLLDDRLGTADLETPVLAQLGLRQHADLDRELEALPTRGQLPEIDLRVAHRDDAGGVDGVGVPARESVAHGLLQDGLAPDTLDHQRRGHLAASKARELQLAGELAGLVLDAHLELPGGHLHLQAHPRLGQLGDGGRESA